MFKIENKQSIGNYIDNLIKKKGFKSHREFGKKCLILRDKKEPVEFEINNMNNRLSQIANGKNAIQIYDLPLFTELLGVSCEEILSCGKSVVPKNTRVTNYDVAYSKDKSKWDTYINHPDNLYQYYDEYGKSVIDYALEFRNYKFIKYLMDEGIICFIDNSERLLTGFSYGAGIKIIERAPAYTARQTKRQVEKEDYLRTQTIALAIENNDFEILDILRAREVPQLDTANIISSFQIDLSKYKNIELISAVANSNENILDYFSEEFKVTNNQNDTNTFMFPYIGSVIDKMLKDNKNPELLIRRALRHNKKTYGQLNKLVDEAYKLGCDSLHTEIDDELSDEIMSKVLRNISFDESNSMVSFYYAKAKKDYSGIVTNIVNVKNKSNKPLINELIAELNEWYEKIIDLRKKAKQYE